MLRKERKLNLIKCSIKLKMSVKEQKTRIRTKKRKANGKQ